MLRRGVDGRPLHVDVPHYTGDENEASVALFVLVVEIPARQLSRVNDAQEIHVEQLCLRLGRFIVVQACEVIRMSNSYAVTPQGTILTG